MPVQKKKQQSKQKKGGTVECGQSANVEVKVGEDKYKTTVTKNCAVVTPPAATGNTAVTTDNANVVVALPAANAPGRNLLRKGSFNHNDMIFTYLDMEKRSGFIKFIISKSKDIINKEGQIYVIVDEDIIEYFRNNNIKKVVIDGDTESHTELDIEIGDKIVYSENDSQGQQVDIFVRERPKRETAANVSAEGGARRKVQKKKSVQEKVLYKKDAKHQPTRPSIVYLDKSGRKFIKVSGSSVYLDTIRGKYRYVTK